MSIQDEPPERRKLYFRTNVPPPRNPVFLRAEEVKMWIMKGIPVEVQRLIKFMSTGGNK